MENPYMKKLISEFFSENQRLNNLSDTDGICDEEEISKEKLYNQIMELIKMGIPFYHKDDSLFIIVENKEYEFSLSQVKAIVDKETFLLFFPEKKEETFNPQNLDMAGLVAMIELTNSLQKEKESLKKECDELKKRIQTLTVSSQKKDSEELNSAIQEINIAKKTIKMLEDDKTSLSNKIYELETLLSERQSFIPDGAPELAMLREKIGDYEQQISKLEKLAYHDSKTGVLNANAFNRDIACRNKNATTFAMISICKMRDINERYGRENGDAAIQCVADKLVNVLGAENIYRVMGDKFNVLVTNSSYNDIYNKLADIKDSLAEKGTNIEMVFGVSDGKSCKDKSNMISLAEQSLLEMKSSPLIHTKVTKWETNTAKEDEALKEDLGTEDLDTSVLLQAYLNS